MAEAAKLLHTAIVHNRANRFRDAESAYLEHLQADALSPDGLRLLGALYLQTGQKALAAEVLEKAARVLPNDPETLANFGTALTLSGRPGEALPVYRKALRLRPNFADAAFNLAASLHDLSKLDEAEESCREVLRIAPESANGRVLLGAVYQEKGLHELAVRCFLEALEIEPGMVDARWNLSLSLLALGRYREGWRLFEAGIDASRMRRCEIPEGRRWNGEAIEGKRLLIVCEGGFGDCLQFVRYAEMCKIWGAEVAVKCPAPLRGLFANCAFVDTVEDEGAFDFYVPMMSLPLVFGTEVDSVPSSVPYLKVGEAARARWRGKVSDGDALNVGIAWAGESREGDFWAKKIDGRRSVALEELGPLFGVNKVAFFSLQAGERGQDIERCGLGSRVVDLMAEVRDFEDTAAIVEQLDLVISVDTAVAHLAGALGKPVWVLSRFDACWRWLRNRRDSPWYPTVRVFGQKVAGDWGSVVEDVRWALGEKTGL